jgi:hypothetical protein
VPHSFKLVAGGRPEAAILWWSRAGSPVPAFAASEIQAYVRKMSGATLPVFEERLHGQPASLSSLIVIATGDGEHVGGEPSAGEWLAPLAERLPDLRDDGFVIQSLGERIALAGANERGTLYAAYSLLERLGVRFFAPSFPYYGEHAEYVPSAGTVEVPDLDVREEPSFFYRRKYVEEGWSHTPFTLVKLVDWMAKNRLNVLVYPYDYQGLGTVAWDLWRERLLPELERRGMILEVGDHGYQSFLPRATYAAKHPEWFPSDANVFDVANDRALQTYADNVLAYLRAHPEVQIFDAWPPDAARWSGGTVRQFGGIPEAQAHATNALNAAVRSATPGVTIEALAYIPATEPPSAGRMYDAIIVDVAPWDRSQGEPISGPSYPVNLYYKQLAQRWRERGFQGELGMYEYYRRYSWHSLPVVLSRLMAQEVPLYRSLGYSGLGMYSEPADWITYELTHLLVAALSWDTKLDAEAYVRSYLEARYGSRAAAVETYLGLVEETGRTLFTQPRGRYDSAAVVGAVRDRYVLAREALVAAGMPAEDMDAASFLLRRLVWNLDFAIADTAISYHALRYEPDAMMAARERAQALVERHRLDGIILQNSHLQRRYQPGLDWSSAQWMYSLYRDAW